MVPRQIPGYALQDSPTLHTYLTPFCAKCAPGITLTRADDLSDYCTNANGGFKPGENCGRTNVTLTIASGGDTARVKWERKSQLAGDGMDCSRGERHHRTSAQMSTHTNKLLDSMNFSLFQEAFATIYGKVES